MKTLTQIEPNLILGIEAKVRQVLKEKGLTPAEPLEKYLIGEAANKRSFYNTQCVDNQGNECFLKFLLRDDSSYLKSIKREIAFCSSNKNGHNFKSFAYPKIKDYEEGDYNWYIREYYEGRVISNGYYLKPELLVTAHTYVKPAIEALLELISVTESSNEAGNFSEVLPISFEKYLVALRKNDKWIAPVFPSFLGKAESLFKSKEALFQHRVLNHGDFHLGNFFIHKDKLIIIDWGSFGWGNVASDFAKMWVSLWQFPGLQEDIMKHFTSGLTSEMRDSFHQLFAPMLIYHGLNNLSHWIFCQHNEGKHYYSKEVIMTGQTHAAGLIQNLFEGKNYIRRSQ